MTIRDPGSRRRRREGGAIIVEAAFILPVLFMVVVGLVTYGTALGQRNSLENAAREASRYGATRPVSGTNAWLDAVAQVAVAAATGEIDAGAPGRHVCVALVGAGSSDGRREVDGTSAPSYFGAGNCKRPDGSDVTCPTSAPCVQVALHRSVTLDAVAFTHSVTIDAANVSVFERLP